MSLRPASPSWCWWKAVLRCDKSVGERTLSKETGRMRNGSELDGDGGGPEHFEGVAIYGNANRREYSYYSLEHEKRIFVSLRSKQHHLGGNSPKENGLAQLQTVERFSKWIEKRCLIGTTILYLFWVLLKSIFKGERSLWPEEGGAFKMCISHGQSFIFVPDSQCLSLLHFLSRASPKCPT